MAAISVAPIQVPELWLYAALLPDSGGDVGDQS